MESSGPIRVAITNDFELVVAGLARMLGGFDDRVTVLDTATRGAPVDRRVDVALLARSVTSGTAWTRSSAW